MENTKININNEFDLEFNKLVQYLEDTTFENIYFNIVKALNNLKVINNNLYQQFVQYFSKYPLWGSLNPDFGDFTTLQLRAEVLKNHTTDFVWLYNLLNDYLSKRTLVAILLNWAFLDINYLVKVKSIFSDYWEPDLYPSNRDDVLVDVGAFNGDSIYSYVKTYGTNYKKIYAYEITPSSCLDLKQNVLRNGLHDVIIRQKAAGSINGKMFLDDDSYDSSANKINKKGKVMVDVVRLEDDLEDIPTFIKMDIEGAEKDALKGLENIIKTNSPKLAICVYHGYDDLWMIPKMIYEMNPNYDFYLRHNGGNLIPTEFVLLCKPKK